MLDASLGAAVVRNPDDLRRLRNALNRSVFDALPLIGLSGDLRDKVDIVVGADCPTIAGALTALCGSIERATRLPPVFADIDDDAVSLLAYLAVRDAPLTPVYTPDRSTVAHFPVQRRLGDKVELAADRLAQWGLLTAHFDERINVCSGCGSGRVIVRELCSSCQSAQIANESIIHHFRCAEEAPESHFRHGTSLVCPKCRQYLRHFSVDYDKPGTVVSCASCGHLNGEPGVGFRCLDCGRTDLADRLRSREICSYAVTDAGHASIFDKDWLADFALYQPSGAQAPDPALRAVTTIDPRSDATLVEIRFAQGSDNGWPWSAPGTQNQFDLRTQELTQRLVREHFADDAIDFVDAPDGFDALIESNVAAVQRQLPGLELHIRQLVEAQASCTVRSHLRGTPVQYEAQ